MNIQVEDHNRQAVFLAERDSGCVHHAEAALEHVEISNGFNHGGGSDNLWVGIINAVDLGGLHDHGGNGMNPAGLNAKTFVPGQGFAGKFEQDSFKGKRHVEIQYTACRSPLSRAVCNWAVSNQQSVPKTLALAC